MTKRRRDVKTETHIRDAGECQLCDTKANLTVHHIIRLSDGGADDEMNTILLCRPCHDFVERLYDKGIIKPQSFYNWLDHERKKRQKR